jgi:hypothetical protein
VVVVVVEVVVVLVVVVDVLVVASVVSTVALVLGASVCSDSAESLRPHPTAINRSATPATPILALLGSITSYPRSSYRHVRRWLTMTPI